MDGCVGSDDRLVIFVGGTAYSGSTLLDMILANDPAGFSCGEVLAVFHPYRKHHHELAGLSQVVDWQAFKASGSSNLYANIFRRFPQTRFIVDSSKSPLWISERATELHRLGVKTSNVLIWKSPIEFYESRRKRGQVSGWQRAWINYHRYYFTTIRSWTSLRYRDLVSDDATLPHLCKKLGIAHFPGKERYWDREQHTVFGNDAARVHLYDESTGLHTSVRDAIARQLTDGVRLPQHRTVKYTAPQGTDYGGEGGILEDIQRVLRNHDVNGNSCDASEGEKVMRSLRTSTIYHYSQIFKLKFGGNSILEVLRR